MAGVWSTGWLYELDGYFGELVDIWINGGKEGEMKNEIDGWLNKRTDDWMAGCRDECRYE